jgi:ribosome-binding factor A
VPRDRKGSGGRSSAKLRVGEEIRMKLSQLMMRELDDPRLDGVHLTRVEMTPDLAVARIFWRTTPGAAAEGVAAEALKSASGFLRGKLGKHLRLRGVPQLEFRLDEMIDSGARIDDLLAGLVASRAARPGGGSSEDE